MEQPDSICSVLSQLIEAYRQAYLSLRGELPEVEVDDDWLSPCLNSEFQQGEFHAWLPVKRECEGDFEQVEKAMAIKLPESAKAYWNSYYSANITIDSSHGIIELLQPWNEEDYTRFQQNLVGHLLTQQRFKLPYSVFIGVMHDGEEVVAVDLDGKVWLEIPGRKQRHLLSETLLELLMSAEPVIVPSA